MKIGKLYKTVTQYKVTIYYTTIQEEFKSNKWICATEQNAIIYAEEYINNCKEIKEISSIWIDTIIEKRANILTN